MPVAFERYPPEWKDACRSVIRKFQEIRQAETKKKFGATAILREIDAACIRIVGKPSHGLRRQDIDHWLISSIPPGDAKFVFIDMFIRSVELTASYGSAVRALVDEVEQKYIKMLNELYMNRSAEQREMCAEVLRLNRGACYASTIRDGGPYERIYIHFREVTAFGASVTVLYMSTVECVNKKSDKNNIVATRFGFFVPVRWHGFEDVDGSTRHIYITGVLKLFQHSHAGALIESHIGQGGASTIMMIMPGAADSVETYRDKYIRNFVDFDSYGDPQFPGERKPTANAGLDSYVKYAMGNYCEEYCSNLINRYLIW